MYWTAGSAHAVPGEAGVEITFVPGPLTLVDPMARPAPKTRPKAYLDLANISSVPDAVAFCTHWGLLSGVAVEEGYEAIAEPLDDGGMQIAVRDHKGNLVVRKLAYDPYEPTQSLAATVSTFRDPRPLPIGRWPLGAVVNTFRMVLTELRNKPAGWERRVEASVAPFVAASYGSFSYEIGFHLRCEPPDLHTALWLQLADDTAAGCTWGTCARCGKWFRQTRLDQLWCSKRCGGAHRIGHFRARRTRQQP